MGLQSGIKLTKRVVDAAQPKGQRYELWDSEVSGFGLRVEASGTKTFIVRYRAGHGGRGAQRRFVTIGRYGVLTPDEARRLAKDILADVSKGHDPAEVRHKSREMPTFAEFSARYLKEEAENKIKPTTLESYEGNLRNHALHVIGHKKLDEIYRNDVAKLHRTLGSRRKPATANRVVKVISGVYRYAQTCGFIEGNYNPTKGIEFFKEQARERYLTTEELQRLGEALTLAETEGLLYEHDASKPRSKHAPKLPHREVFSVHAIAAIRLLLFTGCRLREILHLRWDEVNFERGLLFLSDSKTGKKTVILSAPALAILQSLPRCGDYVIEGKSLRVNGRTVYKPKADLKRPWARVTAHAGLEGLRLHDLRHTYASYGAGAGLGLPIIGKLLGHSQPSTTQRYAHLDNDPLRHAANAISNTIEAALSSKKGAEIVQIPNKKERL